MSNMYWSFVTEALKASSDGAVEGHYNPGWCVGNMNTFYSHFWLMVIDSSYRACFSLFV